MKALSTKDKSSLEWSNAFPKEWGIRRAKTLFHPVKRATRTNDEIVTAFRNGTVTLRRNKKEDGFTIALQESGYQGIRKGDLVIHGMDGFAGAIGVSDSDGKATPVYSVCIANHTDTHLPYYSYLLRSLALNGFISLFARGIRERSSEFKWNIIGDLRLLQPSPETQKRIADFLDEKTKIIDQLIEKKKKLIELLREKRAALITRAVIKGLDPKAKMKSSGAEWLGEIPDDWIVDKISSLFTFQNRVVSDVEFEALSVTYSGVKKQVDDAQVTDNSSNRKLVQKGDLVINARSDRRGACGVSHYTGSVSTVYHVLDKKEQDMFINYFHHLFRSSVFAQEFYRWGKGIHDDMWTTRSAEMKRIQIPVPPNNKQQKIANYLDEKVLCLDRLLILLEKVIDNLKEYRASLIYSAVTGNTTI